MPRIDVSRYPPAIRELLSPPRVAELGPGRPNQGAFEQLRGLSRDSMAPAAPLADPLMADACIAGLWLYHDFLDRSHSLSQEIETTTGSYWHGIMHRREPDASNAKYWFRRVGQHPVFAELCDSARCLAVETGADGAAAFLTTQQNWDPFAMIDLVERARTGAQPEHVALCERVQQSEWDLLFAFCYRSAVGK
ncbi:MAG: hypothetical protein R3C10_00240 [Pirellulales bacterium]|nr:hypothetical protein [Planctomycetales bacterium]